MLLHMGCIYRRHPRVPRVRRRWGCGGADDGRRIVTAATAVTPRGDLVGREGDVRALQRSAALGGGGGLLVVGEPGIGKSALLDAVAAAAGAHRRVLGSEERR